MLHAPSKLQPYRTRGDTGPPRVCAPLLRREIALSPKFPQKRIQRDRDTSCKEDAAVVNAPTYNEGLHVP